MKVNVYVLHPPPLPRSYSYTFVDYVVSSNTLTAAVSGTVSTIKFLV